VHFACTVGRTTPLEHVPAKPAGDEHASDRRHRSDEPWWIHGIQRAGVAGYRS
jgi:hypothetical protein